MADHCAYIAKRNEIKKDIAIGTAALIMFFLLLDFYLCDNIICYFDNQMELYMIVGAFVEVKGEGVMKERISKVDIESVIDLEIDFEGGFAVGWQFENSGGYSNLFN